MKTIINQGETILSNKYLLNVAIAENTRNTAELNRETKEAIREQQEEDRETNTATAIANAETATQDAIDATASMTALESQVESQENERQDYYNAYKLLEDYNNSHAYIIGNKVKYLNSTYQCILATTGNSPLDRSDNTWWKCIAARGIDGTGGDMMTSVYDVTNKNTDIFEYVDDQIGDRSLLPTSNTDLVGAINENKSRIDTLNTDLGDKSSLTTTDKSNTVGAINEVVSQLAEIETNNNQKCINVLHMPMPFASATIDGTTENTTVFQNAINTGLPVFVPYIANGYICGSLDLPANTKIFGDRRTIIYANGSTLYNINGNHCTIEDFTIDMRYAPADSTAILFKTSTAILTFTRIKKIDFYQCYHAIQDEVHATNHIADLQAVDCTCYLSKGRQVYMRRTRGMVTFREFIIDNTYNTTAVTWNSARFEDFVGLELEKFDVLGPVPAFVTPVAQSIYGLEIVGVGSGYTSVWLTRILVDNTMGNGILLSNILNLTANFLWAYQNLGSGITFTSIGKTQLSNIFVAGSKLMTGSATSSHGLTFDYCQMISATNLLSFENNGSGVVITNSNDNNFTNVRLLDNVGYGWYEGVGSNRNIVNNSHVNGNSLGKLVQSGDNSAFLQWNDGTAFRASDIGVVTL